MSDFKCKFDSTTCTSNQKWNNNKYQCACKKYHTSKKDYNWNSSTRICEYWSSIVDDSVIVCDKIVNLLQLTQL